MAINYETDLLKHHIRKTAWLPLCKNRLRNIRAKNPPPNSRRLKYFTFCAVGAMDVLMLDVAKVIRPSAAGRFDTVVFFDRNTDAVLQTQKRIPGAIGFSNDFVKVVLLEDEDDDIVLSGQDSLLPQENAEDNLDVRMRQNLIGQHRDFVRLFPFDVINLDLEEFLFKPNDPLPGKVVNALRKMFEWQGRGFNTLNNRQQQYLDGFSLMFTTRIGPENISQEYIDMLKDYLEDNLERDNTLRPLLEMRADGINDVNELQERNFELFFKLSIPKVLSSILMERDWYIDPQNGITVYEFEREPENSPPYKMLHLVMDVKRQMPINQQRAPRINLPLEVQKAYKSVVHRIFTQQELQVTLENIHVDDLQRSLDSIIARRRLYCQDEE